MCVWAPGAAKFLFLKVKLVGLVGWLLGWVRGRDAAAGGSPGAHLRAHLADRHSWSCGAAGKEKGFSLSLFFFFFSFLIIILTPALTLVAGAQLPAL